MALPSVREIVKKELPYLVDADDPTIDNCIIITQYQLQPYLDIEDADVEDEANYTNRQNILVAYHTAFDMICQKIILNMEGNTQSSIAASNKTLKKAKADVTEVEFQVGKASDGNKLLMESKDLKKNLQKKTCNVASSLEIILPLCDEIFDRSGVVEEAFIFFPTC